MNFDKPWHKDEGKPALQLIPPNMMLEVGKVFTYGQGKYGVRNWEVCADRWDWCDLIGSSLRHIFAWMRGYDLDEETGCYHLAHAVVNLMMLGELSFYRRGTDDRTKLGEK